MAQPLPDRLRPARQSGLASPDLVRHPTPPGHADSSPSSSTPDKPQNRQRQEKHAIKALTHENGYAKSADGSRLSTHAEGTSVEYLSEKMVRDAFRL
jgi:hypothetical protein